MAVEDTCIDIGYQRRELGRLTILYFLEMLFFWKRLGLGMGREFLFG